MSGISIERVVDAEGRRAFLELPRRLYEDDSCWVPPLRVEERRRLDPRRGHFFEHGEADLFLARRDGEVVGRISAHVDRRHDRRHGRETGFFGFFECRDDRQAATRLLDAAERWLSERGRERIVGPLSFTVYEEVGVLIDGFEGVPYLMNGHAPPYYRRLLEDAGYRKEIDWHAYRTDRRRVRDMPDRWLRFRDRVLERPSFRLEPIRRTDVGRLAPVVKRLFDAAWDGSWGHVPMSDERFRRTTLALVPFLIPELSFVAYVRERPVGFLVSVRDPNPVVREIDGRLLPFGFLRLLVEGRRSDRVRVMMMGLLEAYRGRGYDLAMYGTVMTRGVEMGLRECEMSNVSERNGALVGTLEKLPVERYKTYRVFAQELPATDERRHP